jgi:PAS domain S-box-containing protein
MLDKINSFKNAPFGYALHKILLDSKGNPVDYEFIEVNDAFQKITGLKKDKIIGNTAKVALPGINKGKFDWIGLYGNVALENSEEVFEQYSEPLGKYYSVHAYSPEKEYFITIFTDITDKIEENAKLLRIINNANLGIWEWNIQTGETAFNEQWAKIVGYTLEELSPVSIETWAKLSRPDDLKKSNEKLNAHFSGKTAQYQCEARMLHKNGQWVWVLDTGKVTKWTEEGKPLLMCGVHQEITERKQAELRLYQKLETEKLLSEISSDFIHTTDIDASIIKSFVKLGAITQASRIYLFMLDAEEGNMSNTHEWCAEGVSAEKDNLQNLPLSIFPWWMKKIYNNEIINIPDVSKMLPEAKAEQEILESQNIKSVLVLPVYAANKLKGFVGFDNVLSIGLWSEKDTEFLCLLVDILSNAIVRRINEEELRLLTKAVEESPVSTLITDSQGTIIYVNSSFEKTTGYKTNEVLGKNPSILNSGKQPKSFYAELWDTILAGNIWQGELRNKSKSGKVFWTRELISPIKQNDRITHFVSMAQDITENKKFLNELLEAKEKAEESDRLKSAFLATMSHELRTPLNHVLGFSDMIPDMTDDESIKKFAGLIHESGSNLLNIIEDIFDLAMVEQSEIKIREDVVFIRDIYTELKNQLQEVLSESNKNDNIRLNSKIDSSIATRQIITDKSKVIQVMSNIIKNAVKYTHNGEISFSLMFVEGNYLSIKVKDTGIGIPKDKLEIIFEFFRQGDDSHTRKYEGVGIGLAISKRIANAMGGTIKVESELDMGSEFTFSFPLTIIEENMINPEKENTSFTVPDLSGKNILIVEDDTIGMGMIVNLLKPSKCKIINAVNGKEAIEVIKANPETDIILMDLKMPVMDGFEATRAIRKEFSDLPIIALTAYSLQKDKRKALDAGCNDIITKPIKKEIMFNKLQDFLVK